MGHDTKRSMTQQTKVYLHMGSNQGQRLEHLTRAEKQLTKRIGSISKKSNYYETEAWGKTDQPDFINQALELHTGLDAKTILREILNLELDLGRIRKEQWGQRIIDIDILFYGQSIIKQPDLQIPHPRLHLRNFVLIPMMEISADFIHPIFKLSIEELYLQSSDRLEVYLLER